MHWHVVVDDPVYHSSLLESFIDYRVTASNEHQSFIVRRRYSDFVRLQEWLIKCHGPVLLPELPKSGLKTLIDRYNPGLLQERRVRLQMFLDYALRSIPNTNIIERFVESPNMPSFPVTPQPNVIGGPSIIGPENILELEKAVEQELKVVTEIYQHLIVLRRYLVTFAAFEAAYSNSREKLAQATKAFIQARKKTVRSGHSSRKICTFADSITFEIEHYIGLSSTMDKLKVKAEKTKRALLEASCREIDATTRAKLEEVNEVINFDQMFLLHENQKSVAEECEQLRRSYHEHLVALDRGAKLLESSLSSEIHFILETGKDGLRNQMDSEIQKWKEMTYGPQHKLMDRVILW